MITSSVIKVLGPSSRPYVETFLRSNKDFLESKSISTKLNTVGNYVSLLQGEDYSQLSYINPDTLLQEYENYVENYKRNYSTKSYQELNKIILDLRRNGKGFYWVDLEKEFCIESMIRMMDCGRVNYGNTTLELREQLQDSNTSHLIIVYEKETGNIRQVKGKHNSKPGNEYLEHFYNFLIRTDYTISKYLPTFKPENDLKVEDLTLDMQLDIYIKFPKLCNINSII